MDMSSFSAAFFDEASEHLDNMESLLLDLDVDDPNPEDLNAIFRAAHSVKGGAATFGFEYLQKTTHIFENILDSLRNNEFSLRAETVDLFLRTKDILKSQLSLYKEDAHQDEAEFDEICAELNAFKAGEASGKPAVQQHDESDSETHYEYRVTLMNLDEASLKALAEELGTFGTVTPHEAAAGKHPFDLVTTCDAGDIAAVLCFIANEDQFDIALTKTIEPEKKEAKRPAKRATAGTKSSSAGESSTLRVPVDKVDQIINLVGELVITQSMLEQTISKIDASLQGDLSNNMALLKRNARDLQESIMSIRMVPMDSVFSRFPRQVRDLAGQLGKDVELVTEGKSTELDKSLVEKIVDPLSHLVRNSLDHGLETPEKRIAAGKPATGVLTLSAKHEGGNIVIEVSDDGAGLSRERILNKALSNGLTVPDNITDDEVWQLIFAPGFSTAEVVTDVSGRGVGMDVVKRNIQSLGGSVQILSREGAGTTTRIALPLTMAILDGMTIRVGDEMYILPIGAVIESLQPKEDEIFSMAKNGKVLKVRESYLPLVLLDKILDIPGEHKAVEERIAVIVQFEGTQYALIVDELVGQQQVVVKNLETNYKRIPCFSAATILGDGSVSLILDVAEIFKTKKEKQ